MRGVVGSEYDSRTSLLSSYPGSVTFFLTFFFLFIISFFAHELFMWPIYRPVACNELMISINKSKLSCKIHVIPVIVISQWPESGPIREYGSTLYIGIAIYGVLWHFWPYVKT